MSCARHDHRSEFAILISLFLRPGILNCFPINVYLVIRGEISNDWSIDTEKQYYKLSDLKIEMDDANDWILRILYSLFHPKKWKIFHAKWIPKTKIFSFVSVRNFYFSKRLLLLEKVKVTACSPAIEGKIENKEKNYLIVLLFNWMSRFTIALNIERETNRVSGWKKERLVDEHFRPMRGWLTRARRAREGKERDIKNEEE